MATIKDLIKDKKWDEKGDLKLQDSNLAGIGSDADMALRKNAAMGEPEWTKLPENEAGLWIWRIEDFEVVAWPPNKYGKFFENDSYVVLLAELVKDKETGAESIERNIYYWLGKTTSIDEKGAAALKTIELDDFYDGACTHHREVQSFESGDFQDLIEVNFGGITYMPGGIESGFDPVQPGLYLARLMRVRKRKGTRVFFNAEEVPRESASLNQAESFVLDAGKKLWVWCGEGCGAFSRNKAGRLAHNISQDRPGAEEIFYGPDEEFWNLLGGETEIAPGPMVVDSALDLGSGFLYSIQVDENHTMSIQEVARENLKKDMLDTTAIMLLWARDIIYVWVGKGTSKVESRGNPMRYAINFIADNHDIPQTIPISVIREGNKHVDNDFEVLFGGHRAKKGGMCGSGKRVIR